MRMAREKPWQFRLTWNMVCTMTRYAPHLMARRGGFFTGLPEADKVITKEHPELGQALYAAMIELVHRGARGPQWDAALAVSPWDFPIDNISILVYLWQGEDDRNVSLAAGQYLARAIPDCRASFFPGEGHVSLVVNHLEGILHVLAMQTDPVCGK